MQNKINPGYEWEPQRFDSEFVDAVLGNLFEYMKFKKMNVNVALKKAGVEIPCDHPASECRQEKVAEIAEHSFKYKEWAYKCGKCNSIVFPKEFSSLPSHP